MHPLIEKKRLPSRKSLANHKITKSHCWGKQGCRIVWKTACKQRRIECLCSLKILHPRLDQCYWCANAFIKLNGSIQVCSVDQIFFRNSLGRLMPRSSRLPKICSWSISLLGSSPITNSSRGHEKVC